jgi:inhibitor of KinA sporulation pathway (predicted exonuclease)
MDVLFIVDVEATCWKDRYAASRRSEIIELGGTTLMNIDGELEILGSFSEFIKPKLHPRLSNFCKKLTSIKQEDVNNADNFTNALKSFREKAKATVNGMSCRRMIFASWSPYDRKQIRQDCKLHELRYPFGRYWDLEKSFSGYKKEQRLYSVTNALISLGEEYKGQIHRAISDAENTATIVQKSMSVNWKKYFEKFEEEAKRKRIRSGK